MGRRFCPGGCSGPAAFTKRLILDLLPAANLLLCAAVLTCAAPAAGEPEKSSTGSETSKMIVEAGELRYDANKNTVSAEGNARVYYKGRALEADRIVYDRNTGRVYAEGRVKLTERDGTVMYAERLDLTSDFRDGFIESLRAETPPRKYINVPPGQLPLGLPELAGAKTGTYKTYFSAPRAERVDANTTVFERGTYTACEPCADNPDKPPLWRVRAKRIIHKSDEKMIYYEDASLEFFGIPVGYAPFFSAPDPSVTRKSGLLSPYFVDNNQLGAGVGIPIFWALAPDYDLTFTPIYYSQQGFFGIGEWRQRFEDGQYYIRASGIDEQNPFVFNPSPYGSRDERLRGSFESKGEIQLNSEWNFGWDFTLLSDKWYLNDYHVPSQTLTWNYFSESTSTVYLTGQGERSYFDLRGYHFEGLSDRDFQPQQPVAHPVWDYNKTFDVDPAKTFGIGGQAQFDFNLTSLSASSASFQAVGTQDLDHAFGLYNICKFYVPGSAYGDCLLRGLGGDYNRATAELSWQRKYIDPLGEVFTPFAFARVNGEWLDVNTSNTYTFSSAFGSSTYFNQSQQNFLAGKDEGFFGTFIPGIGIDYRYPFLATTNFGSIVFEPIGQIIVRPNQQIGSNTLVNLDSQSLVFDTSNLFAWDKFSGYDRFETGTRANYGGQITANFDGGGYINLIGGQSVQVAGTNSYATPDAANIGLSSGLDTRFSDYVTALTIAPNSIFSFMAKARLDVDTLAARRLDLVATYNLGALTGAIQFANYEAQPVIGYYVRREGLSLSSRYRFDDHYFAQGNITFDMSRHLYPESEINFSYPGPFAVAAYGVGVGYQDECTTFSVNYTSMYQDSGSVNNFLVRNQTFLVQLQLRTLGSTQAGHTTLSLTSQNPSASPSPVTSTSLDGLKY